MKIFAFSKCCYVFFGCELGKADLMEQIWWGEFNLVLPDLNSIDLSALNL